jgi:predicted MFS family arabinose efflux permease
MKNPWGQLRGLPRPVWLLFSAILINRAGTMVLPFLVLYLTRSLGLPPGRAALSLTVYGLGAIVTAPLSGRLADRVGPRRIITVCLVLSGLLLLVFPLLRSFPAILLMTLLWSIPNEALRPASMAWMSDLVPPDRRRAAFALTRLAVNLGMSLGPAVGGFVVRVSFSSIFVLDALTSLAAGALLILATRDRAPETPVPAAARGASRTAADAPEGVAPAGAVATGPPRRGLADRRYLYFLLALMPIELVFFQDQSTLPLYLVRDLGLPESTYGLMFTINTLLITLIEVPLISATSEWSYRRVLMLGALLTGCGFGALGLVQGWRGVAALVVIWTFGEMVLLPGSAAYAAEAAPQGRRGEYLGLYSMSFSIAFALGPWLGTRLMEGVGGRPIWIAALACGLLSTLLFLRLRPPRPERNAAPGV